MNTREPEGAPPFFVFEEGHDLTIYDSLSQIEVGLEGIDVEDGVYEAYDSKGRAISLTAKGVKKRKLFWNIEIVDIGETHAKVLEPERAASERFHELLRGYIEARDRGSSADSDLDTLVARCVSICRPTD